MSKPEKISFKYGNMLQVDKTMLQTAYFDADPEKRQVDPNQLQEILDLGSVAIRSHIEATYEKTVARHPLAGTPAARDTVVRPSIWVAQMTSPDQDTSVAYSKRGYDNMPRVITNSLELRTMFRPYWRAIERSGFVPESRQHPEDRDKGAWLLLRTEPTKLPQNYELDS